MRWSPVVLAAASWTLLACKAPVISAPPRTGPPTFDEPGDAPPGASGESDDPPASAPPQGCRAGGVRWDGKHEGCLYEVAGCCYDSDANACAAAGCDAGGCQILESAPAQIHCRAAP